MSVLSIPVVRYSSHCFYFRCASFSNRYYANDSYKHCAFDKIHRILLRSQLIVQSTSVKSCLMRCLKVTFSHHNYLCVI